jgi:hypothetical protein
MSCNHLFQNGVCFFCHEKESPCANRSDGHERAFELLMEAARKASLKDRLEFEFKVMENFSVIETRAQFLARILKEAGSQK